MIILWPGVSCDCSRFYFKILKMCTSRLIQCWLKHSTPASILRKRETGFVFLSPLPVHPFTVPFSPQCVPSFFNTKEKIEVKEVCMWHGAPHCGCREMRSFEVCNKHGKGQSEAGWSNYKLKALYYICILCKFYCFGRQTFITRLW